MVTLPIISIPIEHQEDVVLSRRRARYIAELLGFDRQDQTRIATAVSEIARNAYTYGGGGRAEYLIDREDPISPGLVIRIIDRGPGIPDVDLVLSGRYQSPTGMGLGILGARRLMDRVVIDSKPGQGTTVLMTKHVPAASRAILAKSIAAIAKKVSEAPQDVFEEVRSQNQDLVRTLEQLRTSKAEVEERQESLVRLNRELEDTNRGVVALYAELDERAERLRHADAMKSRFLSYVSHEFRTPLNGIIGLSRLLLERKSVLSDDEAGKQVRLIQKAAEELTEMVNDLLDLAKAEAGKLTVQAADFLVDSLMGALRGLFRAFPSGGPVSLTFDVPENLPPLHTDEAKLAQILRNLLSNALKFTEAGEVCLSVAYDAPSDAMVFSVRDTGIGIAPELQGHIFEEFTQVDNRLQKKIKGTGLGLPLCKRFSELLGGHIRFTSAPAQGSVFTVTIPRIFPVEPPTRKVLIVDDEEVSRYLLRVLLPDGTEVREARNGSEGLRMAREWTPDLIFLDLMMPDFPGPAVLAELRGDPALRGIPVVIATARHVTPDERDMLKGQTTAILRKDVLARSEALEIDFGPPLSVAVRAAGATRS
jgi:signal transduction histidine kinase/CheY-like chemotaxis protein